MQKIRRLIVSRYIFALLVVVLTLTLVTILRRLSLGIDPGFLVILALIGVSWFWGKGPGLMALILFECAVILPVAQAQPERLFTIKYIFAQINLMALFGFLVMLISGRRTRDRYIGQQREWLQVTLSSIGDAVIATDLNGQINFMNPAAEALTGWTDSQAANMPLGEVLQTVDENAENKDLNSSVESAMVNTKSLMMAGNLTLISRDKTEKFINYNKSPIRNQTGQTTGMVLILRDVTERRKVEEALQHTEAQLVQAQKMEAVGQLAGGVAHDFNNLLQVMMGNSQLLQFRLKPADPLRREIDEIYKAGQRAATLTSQLLAFSRKQVIQPKVLNLNAIVENTSKMLSRLIGENIRFRTILDPALKKVKVDAGQMEQILMNLVVNARDAMPEGGSLLIETANVYLDDEYADQHVEVSPGDYIRLVVSDSGCGMDNQTIKKIFEPFFTTKEKGKGTGLGLATVYGIVKQNGGHIWVYSEPDKGTAFKVYLPHTDEEPALVKAPGKADLLPVGQETVLLAEDDFQVRTFISRVLRELGYKVLEASNGIEALDVAGKTGEAIDILLTDVVMPQKGGKSLSKLLKLERPKMQILFLSGYTEDSIVHHGVLDEGVAFLHKPFGTSELAQKVREVLNKREHLEPDKDVLA